MVVKNWLYEVIFDPKIVNLFGADLVEKWPIIKKWSELPKVRIAPTYPTNGRTDRQTDGHTLL